MIAITTVAGKLTTLFIYVLVGYIVCKKGVLSQVFCNQISRFLTMVTLPCLILSTFQADYTPELFTRAGHMYLLSLVTFGGSLVLGHLTAPLFRVKPEDKAVWVYSLGFPNHAFMGWPVMDAVFGGDAVFLATFANMAFCTYAYTYGVWLMAKTGKRKDVHHSLKDNLITPINIAIVIGLILFVTQLRLPTPINAAVNGFSSLTTPLAMFYVGTILTQNSFKEVLADKRSYFCSLMRLIIIPLIILVAALPFVRDELIYGVLVIGHAMPVAGFCAIYAGEYDNNPLLASKFIFVTTLLCIVTIPMFVIVLQMMGINP